MCDGISIREVMEALRGMPRDEVVNQLEGIGFQFSEKELINQMGRLDNDAKRRVVVQSGNMTYFISRNRAFLIKVFWFD